MYLPRLALLLALAPLGLAAPMTSRHISSIRSRDTGDMDGMEDIKEVAAAPPPGKGSFKTVAEKYDGYYNMTGQHNGSDYSKSHRYNGTYPRYNGTYSRNQTRKGNRKDPFDIWRVAAAPPTKESGPVRVVPDANGAEAPAYKPKPTPSMANDIPLSEIATEDESTGLRARKPLNLRAVVEEAAGMEETKRQISDDPALGMPDGAEDTDYGV